MGIINLIMGILLVGNSLNQHSSGQFTAGMFFIFVGAILLNHRRIELWLKELIQHI
jgi:uncharacterized membrane protein HdeD (DUF308 family)